MSTNLKDAIELVKTSIEAATALNSWCVTNFGKAPILFIGIDPRKPPMLEDNCPLIAVACGARSREHSQAHLENRIDIGCAIKNDIQNITGKTVKFKGVYLIDDFINQVEAIITKAFNANGYASNQEPNYPDETDPPFFKAFISYVIRCPSRL